jgi:hypothetical protein
MPPTPIVVLEIDDNTPPDLPPFTNDVSMWNCQHDLNLATRTASETFRALLERSGNSEYRGYPVRVARATVELFDGYVDPSEVTWLTGAEVAAVRDCFPSGDTEVERSLRMLQETVEVAGRSFGLDRVRLVFALV